MYEFTVDMRRWGDGNAAAINQISWRAEVLLTRNKDYIAGKRIRADDILYRQQSYFSGHW